MRPRPDGGDQEDKPLASLWRLPAAGGEAIEVLTLAGGVDGVHTAHGADVTMVTTTLLPSATDVEHDKRLRAVRKDAYKAHFITSGAYGEGEPRREHNPPLLFNLAEDPGERHDVAAQHPEVIADLVREADAHRRAMKAGPPRFDRLLP